MINQEKFSAVQKIVEALQHLVNLTWKEFEVKYIDI